jgi:hypothetical protein
MRYGLSIVLSALLVAGLIQAFVMPAAAHHSEAPFYDVSKTVEIKGVVTRWTFKNPHPFLYVEVTDDEGVRTEWVVEFVGAARLARIGWSAKTFTPGEVVIASGHPSRAEGTHGISSATVARADGTIIPGSGRGDNAPEAVSRQR